MILPFIEYGDICVTSATVENRRKLQVVQNNCLRCALVRDRDIRVAELHDDAHLLKLNYSREQHLLNLMYDVSRQEPLNLKGKRKTGPRTHSSNKKLLKIRHPKTEKFKKSMSYLGPKKWNALPEQIQTTDSKIEFKSKLQAHILAKWNDRNRDGNGNSTLQL